MASKKDPSCSGVGDDVGPIMETLSKGSYEDSPPTLLPTSVSEDEAGPSVVTENREVIAAAREVIAAAGEVIGCTTATRRGTKRSFGEVSESKTSDVDNSNKSPKVDSSPSCSNARTNQTLLTVENKIHSTDVSDETSRVCSASVTHKTLETSAIIVCSDSQDDQTTKKAKTPRSSSDINDCNGTIYKKIGTNITTNNFIKNSNKSASNINSIFDTSDSSADVEDNKCTSNTNVNSTKKLTPITNSNDTSNTKSSRVCNDISNTSAASNSSDTRSISLTRTTAITIVTSSSSCTRISASSRDISNNSSNRTSNDTNNNNRNAVNNNSDDSCQSQSSEGRRTPTLATGRKVYGLRPRSSVRRLWAPERPTPDDESSESPSDSSIPSERKTAGTKSSHGASSKSKPSGSSKSRGTRTKPLSKYRRITANARERERMAEINTAFAALRAALPTIADYRIASMTKYTTLQLASSYIRDLSKLLDETPSSDSENKKENCPAYLHGTLNSSNRRDVNLSVGISELSFERNQQSGSEDKPGDFSSVFPNTVNSINNITEEQLQGLGDIGNLEDMCWALDFMLD